MKRLVCAALSMALLATSASAYRMQHKDGILYGTVDDWTINNHPDMQTKMLETLGLLTGAGTDWQLNHPMTRAEGAVMLCRFLGGPGSQAAAHPFTDVPASASSAVGWLYQNGQITGLSDTLFGADQTMTAEQFARVLARALGGDDIGKVLTDTEQFTFADSEPDRFLRIDAVRMCTRALAQHVSEGASTLAQHASEGSPTSAQHASEGASTLAQHASEGAPTFAQRVNEGAPTLAQHVSEGSPTLAQPASEGGPTLAQRFVNQGRFTAAQFLAAAWDIYPPEIDSAMNAAIAGVRYASRAGEGFAIDRASAAPECEHPYFYATREENGKTAFYRFDWKTMKETPLGTAAHPAGFQLTLGDTDYLWAETGGLLLAVKGDRVVTVLDEAALAGAKPPASMEYGQGLTITAGSSIYEVTAAGIQRYEISGTRKQLWADEKTQIVQIVNPTQTFLQWTELSGGRVLRSYAVPQDAEGRPREAHAKAEGSACMLGEAGLYALDSQGFHQYYDQPVLDFVYSDRYLTNAYCITHAPGVRIAGANGNGGDQLVKVPLAASATPETLIDSRLGMKVMRIDIDASTSWQKVTLYQEFPASNGSKGYTYDYYFDGKIKVTDYHDSERDASGGGDGYKARFIAAEQSRLDGLL